LLLLSGLTYFSQVLPAFVRWWIFWKRPVWKKGI